jgi:hypothetical protein
MQPVYFDKAKDFPHRNRENGGRLFGRDENSFFSASPALGAKLLRRSKKHDSLAFFNPNLNFSVFHSLYRSPVSACPKQCLWHKLRLNPQRLKPVTV